jgi:niacin transporter
MTNNIRKLTITAVLTAFAIIIPMYFGFLSIRIPPVFSATIASHVPMFLSMFFGPAASAFVGIGSALGFLPTFGPVVAARAAMHIVVGVAGAMAIKKGMGFMKVVTITSPLHAILEAVIVMVLTGNLQFALLTVGVGTFIHHFIDGTVSLVLMKALSKSGVKHFSQVNKAV